jgi:hypothetical protein
MRICSVKECGEKHYGRGYCEKHYRIFKKQGLLGGAKCKISGCDRIVHGKGYCQKHYLRYLKDGHPERRRITDPNEFILYPNYAEMIIYDKNSNPKHKCLIDLEDVERVKKYKWYNSDKGDGRVVIHNDKVGYLSRFLLGVTDRTILVDHKNGKSEDNQKLNLRIANKSQNAMNSKLNSNNTSGYKGITWDKVNNKWVAQITYINKNQRKKKFTKKIGRFSNIKDAIKARQEVEQKIFGEFSYFKSRC